MKMIIGGQDVDSVGGATLEVLNPYTLETVDTVPSATEEDVERAIAVAKRGRALWRATPLCDRVAALTRFTQLLEQRGEELCSILCSEIGKTITDCRNDLRITLNVTRAYCERARNLPTETLPLNSEPGCVGDIILTVREPLGIVACIIPFNYPADLYMQKVAPALLMGNAVIVKPSSEAPLSSIFMTRLLLEAGVLPEALQVVTGSGERIGAYLSSHPDVAGISLTGSTQAGVKTAVNGAGHLARVFLELGGNDPLIVFDDADLDRVMKEALQGRAINGGQTCCGTKRFLVQNGIREAFTARLCETLRGLKVGDPRDPETDIGPLISERAAKKVEEQVAHTLAQGAKCVMGGRRYHTNFFELTVLTDVTPEMDIARDMEVFGPVFPIIGFDTAEDAIAIANGTPYGLAAGVMTKDTGVALKVAMALESGTCVLNGCGNYRTAYFGFGGCKMTGSGREGAGYSLEEFTLTKNIVLKQMIAP